MAFSKPIDWKTELDKDTTLKPVTGNGLEITRPAGPLGLTAFYDGFVVYRPGTSPDTGNLEFVLFPDKWPGEMKEFFNPSHPRVAFNSGITELPPGRVVYRDIAKSVIERDLTTLIHAKFDEWLPTEKNPHPALGFIPDVGQSFYPLKYILKDAWNAGSDPDDKKARVDAAIKAALVFVFDKSSQDTLYQGMPLKAGELIANIGDKDSPAVVTLEIRDLYGEPINPRFYLKKLQPIATDQLAPVPPFTADEQPLARTKEPTDQFLPIRIPKHGGAEFKLIKNGSDSYESPLIWDYQYDPAKGTFSTTVSARPGHTVTPPNMIPGVENRINPIWDQDNAHINTYAEFFSCPCELILATIYKEGSVYNTNKGDTHSLRFEPIPKSLEGEYANEYEDLVKLAPAVTKTAVDGFWELAGGWRTKPNDFTYGGVEDRPAPKAASVDALALFEPTDAVGNSPSRKKISWGEFEAIWTAKSDLITRSDMVLPPLGKKTNRDGSVTYHYKLIADDASLGSNVANVYLAVVGGEKSAADPPSTRPQFKLTDYKLPLKKNKDQRMFPEAVDPTHIMTWEKLLGVLAKMNANGGTNVPKATWLLRPLKKLDKVDLHASFTYPKLRQFLSLPSDAAAKLVVDRYIKLMGIDLRYTSNLGSPVDGKDGVRAAINPQNADYLTIWEAHGMSTIYPDKISIGVGQLLIETGIRRVIPFVKKNYGNKLFTDIPVDVPIGGFPALIDWLWAKLWDNRELQISFISAYHKQNATIYWEPERFNKNDYKIGELMTKFDFPRVAAAYNSGHIQKAFSGDKDKDWGMHTFDEYMVPYWSAVVAAVKYFDTFTPPNPKLARVRLRPDLETDSGMDVR